MKGKGMKSATMPKEQFERNLDDTKCCQAKYASKDSMNNPEELKKSVDDLASFVKSHRMKY